ncbi:protein KRI1 homolog [Thamnophis elegans]|uniref:protein KRI1 homolog n=1 Tax=Thamnophis elegans TaxID=35005 RepID=UPI00137898C5|nr:protein KRI1 homolog [Thamnophis elegans]
MPGQPALRVNAAFAARYGKYRRREELQRLQDKYGEEGEASSSESASSEEEELDPKLERDFYSMLGLLKTKDPRIYQKNVTFYTEEDSCSATVSKKTHIKKKEKPMLLKDYERKVMVEKAGKYEDEEEEEITVKKPPTYIEEQKELKEGFRKFVLESDEEEGDNSSALLQKRLKSKEEKEHEEADYISWLKGQKKLEAENELQDLIPLKTYWNDPKLDEGEQFLRDYILNQGYKEGSSEEEEEEEEHQQKGLPGIQLAVSDSSDEGEFFLKKQEDFERKYNFRFEEPEAQQVKTYPRIIATSVRRKDEHRKEKRQKIQERKIKEREQKQQELKHLKNLKRQEILERLEKLHKITGRAGNSFQESDLEGDFDPHLHDQLMENYFGDVYYEVGEEEKPQFETEEEIDGEWNWDKWIGRDEGMWQQEEDHQPHCEDPDFVMDANYDPSQQPTHSKRKKQLEIPLLGKKKSKSPFAEAVSQGKKPFDPETKTFEQYLDEFYHLEYEDLIGDLPCRFKYRTVVPCNYGLSTDEILAADDKELNRWCSLRKTCMYRSEKEELQEKAVYEKKSQDAWKKKRVLKSLQTGMEEEKEGEQFQPKKKKKSRETKGFGNSSKETQLVSASCEEEGRLFPKTTTDSVTGEELDAPASDGSPSLPPRIQRSKKRGRRGLVLGTKIRMKGSAFSCQRLQAYGLNPRALRYRQLLREKRRKKQ